MSLQIHNSLSQKKEMFVPLKAGEVKMYVCGPTVWGLLHIGNFRGAIFFNMVRNWLEKSGYRVTYVYNFTDVDDKIINRAKEEGVESLEISERYIAEFKRDFSGLKLRSHDHNPKVTEYIQPIIDMVGELVKREKAYVSADGEVLYAVRSFSEYGKLSNKNIDDLQSGARVEVDTKKRDPLDFSLWKPAKPGEPKWSSPWSDGRPGWHIECSAMINSILGESIDIHGGGMDLIFPHHENEVAQSEGATGHPFVKYWMHNNMLTFGDKKMSKSLGNILSGRDFLTMYDGEIMKFMMLSVHYRSLLDFSEKQIDNAIAGLARIYSALALTSSLIERSADVAAGSPSKGITAAITASSKAFQEAMNDDFNTPEAFAAFYTLIRAFNTQCRHGQKVTPEVKATATVVRDWILTHGQLMALFQEPAAEYLRRLDDMLLKQKGLERDKIDQLVEERTRARQQRDFAASDELRKKLTELGISLHDTPEATHWEVAK